MNSMISEARKYISSFLMLLLLFLLELPKFDGGSIIFGQKVMVATSYFREK